jgi:hypothetical protein
MRLVLLAIAILVSLGLVALCTFAEADLFVASTRPAQPLPFGTVVWAYETGFTVDGVHRSGTLHLDGRVVRAHGEFYVVDARVLCPFGERFHWHDRDAIVATFAGSGASTQSDVGPFAVDEPVQALLDRVTHRPGPRHVVLGASQREELVFDLPRDVEQPALVFAPANDPWNVVDGARTLLRWQPHRFNLRYD